MKRLYAVLIALPLCACAVAIGAAGAGGVAGYRYVKGELQVTYKKDFASVWDATLKALKELKVRIVEESHDEVEGYLKGYTPLGKKVKIKAKTDGRFTKLRIRVGFMGDKDYALAIKYRIDRILKVKM